MTSQSTDAVQKSPQKETVGHALSPRSECSFTPGPWKASATSWSSIVDQSHRSIAGVTYFNLGEHFDRHDQECRANARLIAAAPDLLKALEDCRTLICGYAITKAEEYPEVLKSIYSELRRIDGVARAALSKAKGERP